jgi:hypothetical protein
VGQGLGEKEIISSLGLNSGSAPNTCKCGNLPVRIPGAEEERTGCRGQCRQGNHGQDKTQSEAHVNLLDWVRLLIPQAAGQEQFLARRG